VLLVSSSKRPNEWIIPGGGIEPEETAENAALRECREEGGVIGSITRRLCQVRDEKKKTITTYFHIRIETICSEFDESWRARRLVTLKDAENLLNQGSGQALKALESTLVVPS